MGASLVAAAGILATALTAPATIIVLRAIGAMPRIGLWQYAGILFVVALPALSFESFDVEASAMPLLLGKWVVADSNSTPFVELWFGAAFVAIYGAIAFATYPLARRGGLAASFATVAPAVVIVAWIAYGLARF